MRTSVEQPRSTQSPSSRSVAAGRSLRRRLLTHLRAAAATAQICAAIRGMAPTPHVPGARVAAPKMQVIASIGNVEASC